MLTIAASLNSAPDLLVLAQRNWVLLVLVLLLLLFAVLGRVGGRRRRRRISLSSAAAVVVVGIAGKEFPQVSGVGVGELLRDQSLVPGADGVAPLASPWSCNQTCNIKLI